jgi:hypothetical protein
MGEGKTVSSAQTHLTVVIDQQAIQRRGRDAEDLYRLAAMPTCLFRSVDDLLLFVAFKVIITETRLRSEWFSSKG